jgi:hypothetical protein
VAGGTDKTLAFERRRECRVPVQLPMLVRGRDRNGIWFEERTFAQNLSSEGAAFTTLIPLEMGASILVSIPATQPGEPDKDFSTKAQIVYSKSGKDAQEIIIGVKFTGSRFQRSCVSVWA